MVALAPKMHKMMQEYLGKKCDEKLTVYALVVLEYIASDILKDCVDSLFGNIVEVHELTVRLLRSLEDAVEMSDSPSVGGSFWELAEGQEFNVYWNSPFQRHADNNNMRTFLTTYRSFCSPSDLLALVIERYQVPTPASLCTPSPSSAMLAETSNSLARPAGGQLLGGRFDTVQSPSLGHQNQQQQQAATFFDFTAASSQMEQSFQRSRKEYMQPIQLRVLRKVLSASTASAGNRGDSLAFGIELVTKLLPALFRRFT